MFVGGYCSVPGFPCIASVGKGTLSWIQFSTGPASWIVDCDLLTYFPENCRSHSHFLSSYPPFSAQIKITKSYLKSLDTETQILPLVTTLLFSGVLFYCLAGSSLLLLMCCSNNHSKHSVLHTLWFIFTVTGVRQGGIRKDTKCNVSLTIEKMLNLILRKYIY